MPTQDFRANTLGARFADPDRARANWGTADVQVALTNRLNRDDLWDAELRLQAAEFHLPIIDIDGTRNPEVLADDLAKHFRL